MGRRIGLVALLLAGLVACSTSPVPGPQFAVGSHVVFISHTNVTLRRDCGQLMSAMTGLAEDGDEAIIRDRRFCASSWWYLVEVPALRGGPLSDTGWVPESNLKNR